jgi:vacuolar-type H+-ATPase subunit I/STV1
MAKTQFNVDQLKAEAVKPLYAVAGATEVAYEFARGYTAEAQKTAAERFSDAQIAVGKIERDPKALQNQAITIVNSRVEELTKDAKDAQKKFEARIAELQKDAKAFPVKFQAQIDEAVAELTKTYESLADRGEKLVAAIRKDGVKAVTAVRMAPRKSTVARRQAAKKGAAKNAPASKAAAEKAPGNKSKPAAKKATAEGGAKGGATAAKKAPATKAATTSADTSSTEASA